MKLALLILVILLAAYDCQRQRVPNWATLPLILIGLLVNLPGAIETHWVEPFETRWVEFIETRWVEFIETLIACALLLTAWRMGWMGGGDAKLWMALLWITPVEMARSAVPTMFTCLGVTGLAQIIWRKLKKRPTFGLRSAGAWRAVPYAVWLLFVYSAT